jgi:serine/threonine protein kinase
VPTHGAVPIWLGEASHTVSLADSRIFLTEFSESFQPAVDIRQFSHTPFMLRSPEILLESTAQVSFPAEIWSLACAVFSLMGQEHLFGSWFPSKDRILAEHVDALGHLPQKWWESWTDRIQYFNSSDQLHRVDGSPRRLLEDRVEYAIQEPRKESGMAEMDKEEKQAFLALMSSMLAYRPDDRISAQQVLESSWVQRWAKPALESM